MGSFESPPLSPEPRRPSVLPRVVLGIVVLSLALSSLFFADWSFDALDHSVVKSNVCAQTEPLVPKAHASLAGDLDSIYDSPAFLDKAAEWLGGAVRVPCARPVRSSHALMARAQHRVLRHDGRAGRRPALAGLRRLP